MKAINIIMSLRSEKDNNFLILVTVKQENQALGTLAQILQQFSL